MKELSETAPSAAAEEPDHFERIPAQDLNLLVNPIRHVDELLLFIG
jgi:hypothetical protein